MSDRRPSPDRDRDFGAAGGRPRSCSRSGGPGERRDRGVPDPPGPPVRAPEPL